MLVNMLVHSECGPELIRTFSSKFLARIFWRSLGVGTLTNPFRGHKILCEVCLRFLHTSLCNLCIYRPELLRVVR